MNQYDINVLINEDIQCEDVEKENKRKIANDLVKNYCLLKELNLLSTIKNEYKEIVHTRKNVAYNSDNIIYASKCIMEYMELKKQNELKIKEEEEQQQMQIQVKKEKEKYSHENKKENILNDNEIVNIMNVLNKNELNLFIYAKNIMECDKVHNFGMFNNPLNINYLDIPEIKQNHNGTHLEELIKLLISNYNNSLNIIKMQQNVINNFIFYTHNLLTNNKMLIQKNHKLIQTISVPKELKNNVSDKDQIKFKLPFTQENNISSLFKIQIDLYRKHIKHLYNVNDDLKKYLSVFNDQNKYANN
ncbi:hypothetical protein PFNF135_04698 [Plasmodium falciparum NF135/5.C10]|uniref:Uncharacterized protein n=1 Tax=Plasmodium falciparum NF135/5.C10 TaxID=1036726 RepID=W4IDE7_PLAFA|nr:hypothetical protein PFNF135_04698 [Plasmodium falciparum NF135/5.C10]